MFWFFESCRGHLLDIIYIFYHCRLHIVNVLLSFLYLGPPNILWSSFAFQFSCNSGFNLDILFMFLFRHYKAVEGIFGMTFLCWCMHYYTSPLLHGHLCWMSDVCPPFLCWCMHYYTSPLLHGHLHQMSDVCFIYKSSRDPLDALLTPFGHPLDTL